MATKLQCEICGGKLIGKAGGIYECDSCGMEYDTTWVKEKIQEIQGTVKVEGTVEVTGKVQIEGGTVQVDASANKDALLKRAFMMLEDGKWDKADELLEQVLNLDPEYGEAYLGKLMVEKKVKKRERLEDNATATALRDSNAFRYGDAKLKAELSEMIDRAEARQNEAIYQDACEMEERGTLQSLQEAVKLFSKLQSYKDSKQHAADCKSRAKVLLRSTQQFTKRAYLLAKNRVASGECCTFGLKSDGTVIATGKNDRGQCNVSEWKDIVAIASADNHTVGLKADGTVVATGDNHFGQCNVEKWKDIVSVSAASFLTVGLKADGTVVATGDNSYGRCNVIEWKNVVAIATGYYQTVGLKDNGTMVATGAINSGVCNVSEWKDITAISATSFHTFGLKKDGTVVRTSRRDKNEEKRVPNADHIIAIEGCAGLCDDGTVVLMDDKGAHKKDEWRDIVAIAYGKHLVGVKADGTVITEMNYIRADGTVKVGLLHNNLGGNVIDWKLFDSIDDLERQKNEREIRRQQEEERRKKEEERRKQEEEQRRQAELARKCKDLSERLASAKQCKQSAETELANLKGLFIGRRRKELEAQIANADKKIIALNMELKTLQ